MAQLRIELDPRILDALTKHGNVKISLTSGEGGTQEIPEEITYREGSLPARIVQDLEGTRFNTQDLMKGYDISRAHASMLLTKLWHNKSIKRVQRGLYEAPKLSK